MTHHDLPASKGLSRRSALGLLGIASLTTIGTLDLASNADASPAAGRGDPPMPVPAQLLPGGAFDRRLAQLAAQDHFSGSALLAYRGRPVLDRAYGMANKQEHIRNRADTIFATASLGKLFTATAIIQLVEQGKVELYETLGTYLDGFPSDIADTVTVHHLLTHTSGMGDYSMSPIFRKDAPTWTSEAKTMDGIMGIVRSATLAFPPGTASRYSNSGFATLGAIVGQVAGGSVAHFYDYIRQHIFAAADMSRSNYYTAPQWQSNPDIAHPYVLQTDGSRTDRAGQGAYIGSPAANAFSTTSDMVRFAHALRNGRLLGPSWAELMLSPKNPASAGASGTSETDGAQNQAGAYGALAEIFNDQRLVTLGGGGPGSGVSANIDMYPELDWDVVVLCNYDQLDLRDLYNAERQPITT